MPNSLRPKVKAALHTIMNAENKEAADLAIDQFETTYGAKYPKAVDKLIRGRGCRRFRGGEASIRYVADNVHRSKLRQLEAPSAQEPDDRLEQILLCCHPALAPKRRLR